MATPSAEEPDAISPRPGTVLVNVTFRRLLLACCAAVGIFAAGCGGSSGQAETTNRVTVPAYGVFSSTTIEGSAADRADSPTCRARAGSFADGAIDFLAHFGPRAA